ncbi:ABC transporter substrate-binding protein [Nonomuraea gerenzanensis]|uniref:Iron(III)-binding periplasmic protein n=1 Tax=Nonomuraea gerenzanensis TaxID=93944 RepID=A0A1M4EMC1_9ACTN|nr:ABC transporter substrate-binding protein [Nonomuraea gerenzanensis]UBU11504.1 ABC transporter substrate-binding protein [Nonomuraea gerenzanensis]SBO99992.1 iron(III)-binding periplasmic protein precursor [Nonomuraea gerenzanensis]
MAATLTRPVLLIAGALVLSGCARAPSTAPADTGKVVVACGATEEWCAAMTSGFTAATGLDAGFVRLSSGEALARIQAGAANPEFDVWHGGPADGYAAAAGNGLLEKYVSPNAAAIPDRYKDPGGTWTGVYVGVLGFCDNTKVLGEKRLPVPQSWQDLLHPGLRQNIGIAHPSTSGTAYTALWTQVTLHGGAPDAALAYMRRLHPNVLQYSKSGAAPAQQVARGEVGVGIVFSHDCVATREQGFTDLRVTFPAEGTGYEVGGVALVKGAHNPVSARRYIDWALTPAAQEIGPGVGSYQAPTNPQARRSEKTADLATLKLVDYDSGAAGAHKLDLTRRFDAEIAKAPKS